MTRLLIFIFSLALSSNLQSQCDCSFLPGEVVMDDSSGRIYMFRKIENGKIFFRENAIDTPVNLNKSYVRPCHEINLIKPFFEEGDFVHTWDGDKFAVNAYLPRWDTDGRQYINIIDERRNRITIETIVLRWEWIKRIEKNNDYQERLKKYNVGDLVFWENENGDIINGWIRYIYSSKKSVKIERYTLANRIVKEDVETDILIPDFKRKLNSYRDTIDFIRTNWWSEKSLVLDLEKKRKYTSDNNIRISELNDEYDLHRDDDFHKWSDERKHEAAYNYSFASKMSFIDTGEIIAFGHGYRGSTSTYDRRMSGKWKYENGCIFIENGTENLLFEIKSLNENHLILTLKRYENKRVK